MQNEEKDLAPRTKMFARRIIRLYVALSKDTAAQVLGKQALRAGTSVGANYREANRARSKAEFIAKIGDCLKEADETAIGWSCWSMKNSCRSGKCPPCSTRPTSSSPFSSPSSKTRAATDAHFFYLA